MKYTKKDLGAYRLHLIETDKFKTVTVRVSFREPIKKEEITLRNILCDMFTQSSKKYRSKRALTIKAQDLYAADVQTSNSRLGNYINTDFYLAVLNDKYTEPGNFKESLQFLSEIIFHPDVEGGKFREDKLDIVKSACRNSLQSLKEDTANYCLLRLFEAFDSTAPSSFRMMGYLEDIDSITTERLYQYYQHMIQTNLVDIFVIGDIDKEQVFSLVRENFPIKTLKKQRVPYLLFDKKPRRNRLFAKETIDSLQTKIAIACRSYGLSDYERNYPLTLYNIILGGGDDSKLFQDVREKNSLCYSIYSVPNKLDHVILIRAGIDKENYKKAIDVIEGDLTDMRKGNFSEEDVKIAKEYFNTALEEVEEQEARIINNYYMMELLGTDDIDEKRKKMALVSKEEIVKVAKKIKMDTVFCLEGVKHEED